MPLFLSRWCHFWSTSVIICGSGSFAVQFGNHFWSWDDLWTGSFGALYISRLYQLVKNMQKNIKENVKVFTEPRAALEFIAQNKQHFSKVEIANTNIIDTNCL